MPYHSSKTFDVDCIAKEGKLVMAIPRLRVYENPLSPTNQGCVISPNKVIYDYCKQLVKAFKITGGVILQCEIRFVTPWSQTNSTSL